MFFTLVLLQKDFTTYILSTYAFFEFEKVTLNSSKINGSFGKTPKKGVVKGCLEEPWAKFGMIYVIVWRFTVFSEHL